MERITSLAEPPVVGRYYLVPTVLYPWHNIKRPWPVFLPKHNDAEHLNFSSPHYHVDPRFVGKQAFEWAAMGPRDSLASFQASPLCSRDWGREDGTQPHPPVVWRKLQCKRTHLPYRFADLIAKKLEPAFVGRQCKRARTGWVCPHKNVPLGSFASVDGVITCPLHGLRVDAETGVVLASASRPEVRL
jgi:nitrite reductase/ring-hydroxylating ferredoxin subunit